MEVVGHGAVAVPDVDEGVCYLSLSWFVGLNRQWFLNFDSLWLFLWWVIVFEKLHVCNWRGSTVTLLQGFCWLKILEAGKVQIIEYIELRFFLFHFELFSFIGAGVVLERCLRDTICFDLKLCVSIGFI
jgi:hypothetical protein